jgi:hypothetical protein
VEQKENLAQEIEHRLTGENESPTNHVLKSEVIHQKDPAPEIEQALTSNNETIAEPDVILVPESVEIPGIAEIEAESPKIETAGPTNTGTSGTLKIKRLSDPVSLSSLTGWLMLQPWFKSLEKSMPSGVTLSIEEQDTEDPQWKILHVREIHSPESAYDPNVSPTVGFFKVSADRKTTLWLERVSDEWKPVSAFLKSRNIADGRPAPKVTASTEGSTKAYTPAKGSPERVAICDSMRAHVIKGYGTKMLPKFLFKIEFIRVKGDYAGFQGFPVKPDGSHFPDGIFEDVVHTTLLAQKNGVWRVVVDLSRTDVPTPQEARQIKNSIPTGFPADVIPAFWREHLKL